MGNYAVFAQHHLFDLRGVGQHGDDHIALCADLLLRCTLCTDSFQLLYRSLTAVIYQQVSVACLQQIFCHGLAHDAKTNKTDLHFIFSFFVSFYR